MRQTVVPNRNAILINLAAGFALSRDIDEIALGAHSGDHDIYPDCRKPFFVKMQEAITIGSYQSLTILTPFIALDKGNVLAKGIQSCRQLSLSWPEVYAKTWTCYKGGELHCGKCGACVERLEAFSSLGLEDPAHYGTRTRLEDKV